MPVFECSYCNTAFFGSQKRLRFHQGKCKEYEVVHPKKQRKSKQSQLEQLLQKEDSDSSSEFDPNWLEDFFSQNETRLEEDVIHTENDTEQQEETRVQEEDDFTHFQIEIEGQDDTRQEEEDDDEEQSDGENDFAQNMIVLNQQLDPRQSLFFEVAKVKKRISFDDLFNLLRLARNPFFRTIPTSKDGWNNLLEQTLKAIDAPKIQHKVIPYLDTGGVLKQVNIGTVIVSE
jgi:hypothetical protein